MTQEKAARSGDVRRSSEQCAVGLTRLEDRTDASLQRANEKNLTVDKPASQRSPAISDSDKQQLSSESRAQNPVPRPARGQCHLVASWVRRFRWLIESTAFCGKQDQGAKCERLRWEQVAQSEATGSALGVALGARAAYRNLVTRQTWFRLAKPSLAFTSVIVQATTVTLS
ncbi:hypothetical protein AXG93_1783s1090 [Marchantia polymorpha subsp. ruderalis]|uniref:Uncharacterized protein n=1 Tax=Marchantia polymorpha subsp. ruderalis TaxID=1480154 RepID=A0A176VC07_MARPO|nr:hypothetical protein AXG93_1783s1090 [Marchantia polymorpha subsp. ruderalis]